jgi:hypothetical protein
MYSIDRCFFRSQLSLEVIALYAHVRIAHSPYTTSHTLQLKAHVSILKAFYRTAFNSVHASVILPISLPIISSPIPSSYTHIHTHTHTHTHTCTHANKQTPWSLVRKRTIPTEQPPLVHEILCQLMWIEGCRVVSAADPPRSLISVF